MAFINVLLSLVCVALVAAEEGQIEQKGQCPPWKPMKNFDITKYAGNWFDIRAYPFLATFNKKCDYGTIVYNGGNNVTLISNFLNKDTNKMVALPFPGRILATAQFVFDYGIAGQNLNLPTYSILDTDYKTFATLFECLNLNQTHFRSHAFVMGGSRKVSDATVKQGLKKLEEYNISQAYLKVIDQNDCPNPQSRT